MPTIQGTDTNFTTLSVPGSGPYVEINGSPARDTTIVPPGGWTASLLLSATAATEDVQYAISGSPRYAWHGFFFRYEVGQEPAAASTMVAGLRVNDTFDGRLYYQSSSDKFFMAIAGGSDNFPLSSAVYTAGSWAWIEMILDCDGGGQRRCYAQMNGTNFVSQPATFTRAASFGTRSSKGNHETAATFTFRVAHSVWGTATGITDWLGQPASPGGSGQTILPDADNVTGGWATAPLFSKVNDVSDATIITATAA